MQTLATRNYNPGNLKDPNTGTFRQFKSEQEGYGALLNDIQGKISGKSSTGLNGESTLHDFSKVYAPASDKNDPAQYTVNLANQLKVRPDTKLKDLQPRIGEFAQAIAKNEGYIGSETQPTEKNAEQPVEQPKETEGYKPTFTSNPNDSTLMSGLKAAGNIPGSALNFGKGLISSFNPLKAVDTISQIPEAAKGLIQDSGGIANAIGNFASEVPKSLYKGLVPQGIQQALSGDTQGAAKTFTEDPFGQVAPVVLAAEGGAKLLDRTAPKTAAKYAENPYTEGSVKGNPIMQTGTKYSDAFGNAVSKTAQLVTKPVSSLTKGIVNAGKNSALSTISQITSLPTSGIVQALKNPETMSKIEMENASRGGLAGEIKTALDSRIKDLSDTGSGYDQIRKSNQVVTVPEKLIENTLAENGLKIKGKKVVSDTNSITRNTSDLNAINKFYKDWGGKKTLTANEFLNMRGDLAELSKFDNLTGMGKTHASETVGKSLYSKVNSSIRDTQLEELKALDDTYSPETQFLKQVKKDYLNPDGTLKDGAGNKIANAGNKAELLKRLEGLMPGITKRIQLLKVIEDVKHANEGFKVGAYTRGGLVGNALLSGNIPAIVASIISSPGNAIQILRAAGYVGSKVAPVLKYLQNIAGDVNTMKSPYVKRGLQSGLLKQTVDNNTP